MEVIFKLSEPYNQHPHGDEIEVVIIRLESRDKIVGWVDFGGTTDLGRTKVRGEYSLRDQRGKICWGS